jgi:hypothetical protein
MSSSIFQRKKEKTRRVHPALTDGMNPLPSEEAHFVEMSGHILEVVYWNTVEIGNEAEEKGKGDPGKTFMAIRILLEKHRVNLRFIEESPGAWPGELEF